MTRREKNKKRKMRSSRLKAVQNIERTKPDQVVSNTKPFDTTTPADPATQHEIQELRKLGLSVSTNTSLEKLRDLRAEFDLVGQYVQDVLHTLMPDSDGIQVVPPDQLNRFTAMLFGDGQLVDSIVISHRARAALAIAPPILKDTAEYKQVSKMLRKQFEQVLPKQSWWARLLGG